MAFFTIVKLLKGSDVSLLQICSKERFRIAIGTVLCLTMMGWGASAVAKIKTITFIEYNDLHAHLTQHKDLIKTNGGAVQVVKAGGLAQIKTVIDQIRKENCNNVLMNIGDTFHGGVEAYYTNGDAITDPVNAMGFDIGVMGNWDFAYGPEVTRGRYQNIAAKPYQGCSTGSGSTKGSESGSASTSLPKQPNFLHIVANVWNEDSPQSLWLPPTAIIKMDGANVGFIGITSDIVPDMSSALARTFIFLKGQDNYRDLINQHAADLRSKGANIVVVMSELGIHKDLKLGEVINPGAVDFIFSAHTHELTQVPITTASGATVVEAGNDIYVGRMDVQFDTKKSAIVGKRWSLVAVTSDITPDPAVQQLVDQARAPFLDPGVNMTTGNMRLTQPIDSVVGYVTQPLDRRHALENTFNDAYSDAYRQIAQTQLTSTSGFRYGSVVPKPGVTLEDNTVTDGAVTLEDMYRFFPFYVPLSTATISGSNLKTVIETSLSETFSATVFSQSGGWYAPFGGLDLVVNLAAPDGSRVQEMRLHDTGQLVYADDQLTVAGCAGNASEPGNLCDQSGFENVLPFIDPTSSSGSQWDALAMFIYALQHGYVKGGVSDSVQDFNNTPLWPVNDYFQPLYGVGAGVSVP